MNRPALSDTHVIPFLIVVYMNGYMNLVLVSIDRKPTHLITMLRIACYHKPEQCNSYELLMKIKVIFQV